MINEAVSMEELGSGVGKVDQYAIVDGALHQPPQKYQRQDSIHSSTCQCLLVPL